MKLIIAGGRNLTKTYSELFEIICEKLPEADRLGNIEIVCGEATGIDTSGKEFAKCHGLLYHSFPANWDKYGRKAGPIRNEQMAKFADALLLIWDGYSKGSKNMKSQMIKLNKPVYEVIVKEPLIDEVNKMFKLAYKDFKW